MTVVDTFNTVETAIKQAIEELKKSLESGKISESRATPDGMIEEWVHDFQIPNDDGVFRLKILIERTTENGSERLPIIQSNNQPTQIHP